jgi:hypothetical protein
MSCQSTTQSEEAPPPPRNAKMTIPRSTMREGLLELFRDTRQPPPPASNITVEPTQPKHPDSEPSRYLRRYLRHGAHSIEPAPSGLDALDACLAGGFSPGLHVVAGLSGLGKTAFLESVAWQTVAGERPVLYYTLKEGSLRVWERLVSTLGHILGEPTIPLGARPSAASIWLSRMTCCRTSRWWTRSPPLPPA